MEPTDHIRYASLITYALGILDGVADAPVRAGIADNQTVLRLVSQRYFILDIVVDIVAINSNLSEWRFQLEIIGLRYVWKANEILGKPARLFNLLDGEVLRHPLLVDQRAAPS